MDSEGYRKERRNTHVHAKDQRRKLKHKHQTDDIKPKPIALPDQPRPEIDLPEDINDSEEFDTGIDFGSLVLNDSSNNSGFVFDKTWDQNSELSIQRFQKYFQVDIERLKLGISTIPFHKRLFSDDSKVKFPIDLVEKYQNDANEQAKLFSEYINDSGSTVENCNAPINVKAEQSKTKATKKANPKQAAIKTDPASVEKLQNWLDDVLDI